MFGGMGGMGGMGAMGGANIFQNNNNNMLLAAQAMQGPSSTDLFHGRLEPHSGMNPGTLKAVREKQFQHLATDKSVSPYEASLRKLIEGFAYPLILLFYSLLSTLLQLRTRMYMPSMYIKMVTQNHRFLIYTLAYLKTE